MGQGEWGNLRAMERVKSRVRWVKNAIKYALLSNQCPGAAVASINTTKRIGKSGSVVEVFFRIPVRPGMSGSLVRKQEPFEQEQEARSKDKEKMMERTSSLRAPESFNIGEIVMIRS